MDENIGKIFYSPNTISYSQKTKIDKEVEEILDEIKAYADYLETQRIEQ